jgi:hypothetical protein
MFRTIYVIFRLNMALEYVFRLEIRYCLYALSHSRFPVGRLSLCGRDYFPSAQRF